MKKIIFFCILLFLSYGMMSQNIKFVGEQTMHNFRFYRIFKKKCPGYISHNDCLRFIDVITIGEPKIKSIKQCLTNLIYNTKLNDTIVLISDVDKFMTEFKYQNNETYSKLEDVNPYDFSRWDEKMVKNKSKFKVIKYSSNEIKALVFKVKIEFLNNEILDGNILVNKLDINGNYIYVILPLSN